MLLWIAHARHSALCDYPLAFCLILVQDAAFDEALLDLSRLITVLLDAHLDFVVFAQYVLHTLMVHFKF